MDDLRSGRSDIKAAPSNIFQVRGFDRLLEKQQSLSDYKAMAAQWYPPYGNYRLYGAHSAEAAVTEAVSKCESEYGGKCAVYSVGERLLPPPEFGIAQYGA